MAISDMEEHDAPLRAVLNTITVKPLSIVFQGTGKFERYVREMIVPGNH
jgi:hypothetical protein